jgi:hypothetical protein
MARLRLSMARLRLSMARLKALDGYAEGSR